MKTYSRVYFSLCLFSAISGKLRTQRKLNPHKNFPIYGSDPCSLLYFWKNNIPLPIRSEYIETITRNSYPNVLLKEPYFPSNLIWMHSNNHSKQWSLFSTMCLKEPHPFRSHIRIHSNNHWKQWSLFSTVCLKESYSPPPPSNQISIHSKNH